MKLKDNDRLTTAIKSKYNDVFISTKNGYGLWFDINEIPVVGLKTGGVKAINLKDDQVCSVSNFNSEETEYISLLTTKSTGKRMKLSEFDKSSRARRGLMILKEVKTNPYNVLKTFALDSKCHIGLLEETIQTIKLTELPILDRYSTGGSVTKKEIKDAFFIHTLEEVNQEEEKQEIKKGPIKKQVSLKEIDERLMTIDDFLK